MSHSEACTELAKLIQAGYFNYPEDAGLAIALFTKSQEQGDDPAMSLAMAKNLADFGEV